MYPDFIEILQNLLPGKIYKKFYSVLHSRLIFYVVRQYVMTNTNGGCLKEWSLAPFAVMSQNFIWTR